MKQKIQPKTLPEKNAKEKKIISIAIVALLGCVVAYFITAKLSLLFYKPDIEAAKEVLRNTLAVGGEPEPQESFLFRLGILTIPIFLIGFIRILTKTKLSKIEWEKYFGVLSVLFVLIGCVFLYLGLSANNPNYVENVPGANFANSRDTLYASNFNFYFAESFLNNNLIGYVLLVVPLLLGILFLFQRFSNVFENKFMRNLGLILTVGYVAYYLFSIYQIFTFDFPYTWENKYDFNVIYYPMTQVFAGSSMLIDNFVSNYGLFPHFLTPVFKIIGLDVSSFTSVMAFLNITILVLILIAMFRVIKSRLLIVLSFSSILFLSILLPRLVTPFDAIFAMFPIRQLVPAIILCIAGFYLFNKKRILYFASLILLGFGILWNPEFGIVAFVAWIATLSYLEFSSDNTKTIIINISKHIMFAIASIIVCFGIFAVGIYLKSHSFPDLTGLFSSIFYFGSLGVGMLPMTLIHPWNFVILIYLIGLTYAIYGLFEKSMLTPKTAFILLLSVMGIGLFMYFQGRSHNWNLLAVMINALILLAIFADMLLEKMKQTKLITSYGLALVLIIAVLGFSFIDLFRNQDKLKALKKETSEQLAQLGEQKQIETNINFIKEHLSETTEHIYIHTSNKYQALYFGACNKPSNFNPSIVDIFTYENCTRLKDKMLLDSADVFIESPNFYYGYVQNTNVAMCATYSVKASNGRMTYLKKRAYPTLTEPILKESSENVVLYEKFDDDTAALNRRIRWALQGDKMTWGNKFSVEIIFYAEEQVYDAATVFSNYCDSCGGMELIKNAGDYYVLKWGQNLGVSLELPKQQWHYLVIQTDGLMMNVFLNGQNIYSFRLDRPIKSSNKNFFIGSAGITGQQYFTGSISEISIKNNLISVEEIKQKYNKLED